MGSVRTCESLVHVFEQSLCHFLRFPLCSLSQPPWREQPCSTSSFWHDASALKPTVLWLNPLKPWTKITGLPAVGFRYAFSATGKLTSITVITSFVFFRFYFSWEDLKPAGFWPSSFLSSFSVQMWLHMTEPCRLISINSRHVASFRNHSAAAIQ